MASLQQLVDYCDKRTRRPAFRDFPGAHNGLQVANDGRVTRIGAAVDAGLVPFERAAERGVDFLIVKEFRKQASGGAANLVNDVLRMPPDGVATGGDATDTSIGTLAITLVGGLA